MIILITGRPGCGKSTVIERLIELQKAPLNWVITKEIRDDVGNRVGFRALNDTGREVIISHKHDLDSTAVIGQNRVDIKAVDSMFAQAADKAKSSNDLSIIDEIGPIQLLSKPFSDSLAQLFEDPRSIYLVATIHASDMQLARYREAAGVLLLQVNDTNRDVLPEYINSLLVHRILIDNLDPQQFEAFRKLVSVYIDCNQSLQLNKLLTNALPYVYDQKVTKTGSETYTILGNHGAHVVVRKNSSYTCDCDLFNGRGKYVDQASVCSHVQAVLISYIT